MTTITTNASNTFRQAMSLLAAAVNIVSTDGPDGRFGVTASAICSVTDTPATLLVCLNQKGAVHDAALRNKTLCINILHGDHESLARTFAGMEYVPHEERFNPDAWVEGKSGLPVLRGALASLEGRVVDVKEVGTHSVLFVEIDHINVREDGECLTYFGRKFHRLGLSPAPSLSNASAG